MTRSPLKQTAAAALLMGAVGAGCLGSAIQTGTVPFGDAGIAGDGGVAAGPDMAVDLEAEFVTTAQPVLLQFCGQCHAQAGGTYPGFLAATATSSVYNTFINFPGLVGYTPETSRILTKDFGGASGHPAPTFHETTTYVPTAEMKAGAKVVADFITLFNEKGGKSAAGDMGVKTRIMPIAPQMGSVNTLDLGQLDPAYTGMSISFTPSLIGTTQIKLDGVKLKAANAMGVKVKSPVFARYAPAAPSVTIDIDYSMLGQEVVAYMGSEVNFGTGILIFPYAPGELLGLSFESIAQQMGTSDMGGALPTCKNLAAFTALKPRFQTAQTGMNNACSAGGCHGVAGGLAGLNLNGIANVANDATICQSVLLNTVAAAPAQSPIYAHTTDASNHAGGKLDPGIRAAFLADVTAFITAQQ